MRRLNVNTCVFDVAVNSRNEWDYFDKNVDKLPCDHFALFGNKHRKLIEDLTKFCDATFNVLHSIEA